MVGAVDAARAPPRGWRSWIAYQKETDQAAMLAAMDAIHKPRDRAHGGPLHEKLAAGQSAASVSLQDLGYSDVGLDGGYRPRRKRAPCRSCARPRALSPHHARRARDRLYLIPPWQRRLSFRRDFACREQVGAVRRRQRELPQRCG